MAKTEVITQIHLELPLRCTTNNGVHLVTRAQKAPLVLLDTVSPVLQVSTLKMKDLMLVYLALIVSTVLALLLIQQLLTQLRPTPEALSDPFCALLVTIVPRTLLVLMLIMAQIIQNCVILELMEVKLDSN
jgi:hypothetical protein